MSQRNLALDYLKTTVIVLVVAYHAVLAYCGYPPVGSEHGLFAGRPGIPIMDAVTWPGFAYPGRLVDTWMMALMFFISGLFVWSSLERKGWLAFLRDRTLRLGLPFVIAVVVLMPITWYPSALLNGWDRGFLAYLPRFYAAGTWSPGPTWFLWVLLAFSAVLVAVIALAPGTVAALGRVGAAAQRWPIAFFLTLAAFSAGALILSLAALGTDDLSWYAIGPFVAQRSRLAHYVIYFLAGVGIGIYGVERGLLAGDGPLVSHWASWLGAGAASAALYLVLTARFPWVMSYRGPYLVTIAWGLAFALACAAQGFALLAVFLRFTNRPSVILENLQGNAFGIYIIHYFFIIWMQYALLGVPLPAAVKAGSVFVAALAASWAITAALRRIPVVRRYL